MIRALLAVLLLAGPALAQTQAPPPLVPPVLDQLRRADGARVVPDRFLRQWDAVTVLFPADTGPATGGPEDAPERLVQMDPPQPGAWTWLGPRTLQFRPAEPWRPLAPVRVTLGGNTTRLVPLLPVPVATGPSDSDTGQPDLDTLALTFSEPVDPAALLRALTIELRPTPGLTDAGAQPLAPADYDLRAAERAGLSDRQTYLLVLRRPVPDGRVAIVRLRLSDQPGLDDPTFEARIRSAAPFALSDAYCGDGFSHETKDGAVRCSRDSEAPGPRTLTLQMTSDPAAVDIVQARDALRISPPVDDLAVTTSGRELRITARFAADMPYELAVAPGALQDKRGRSLATTIRTAFSFAPGQPALAWDAAGGVTERFGPQMVPLRGQGYDRADVRIHAIDPLSRDFWPFPRQPLVTQDGTAPPLPGREPDAWTDPQPISGNEMAARVQALGTPAVSALVDLPIRRGGVPAKFGLDLRPHFSRISGEGQPGTYLVGLRTTDGADRRWMRVQVTDLVLTTVEEADRVRFVVTSLATARPVEGAQVRIEGLQDRRDGTYEFTALAGGTTAARQFQGGRRIEQAGDAVGREFANAVASDHRRARQPAFERAPRGQRDARHQRLCDLVAAGPGVVSQACSPVGAEMRRQDREHRRGARLALQPGQHAGRLHALPRKQQGQAHGPRQTRSTKIAAASTSAAPPGESRLATKPGGCAGHASRRRAAQHPPPSGNPTPRLGVAQTRHAATVREIGVVEHRHDLEQGLQMNLSFVEATLPCVQQRRDGVLEQDRKAERRFLARATQAQRPDRTAAVGGRTAPTSHLQRRPPADTQCIAQVPGRRAPAEPARGRTEQAERENRAAVRVHATRRLQHPVLGSHAQALQGREFAALGAEACAQRKVVPQGEQAAHERGRVHVGVAARIDEGHQARLGGQRQFLVQRHDRGTADAQRAGVDLAVPGLARIRWRDQHGHRCLTPGTPARGWRHAGA